MPTASRKSIDLGVLQDIFTMAKQDLARDAKSLERAQDNFDLSKLKFLEAEAALKAASRTVLQQ